MEWYPCSYSGGDWDSMLDTHGVTPGPQTFPADRGLPFAGTTPSNESFTDIYSFLENHKSGFYTTLIADNWCNVINLRHRNGYGDGKNYAMAIYCRLAANNGDLSWIREANGVKENGRILLDTNNYSSRIFPIVHGNEVNYVYNMDSRTSDYMWINYRDAKETGASKPILEYYFGNGSGTYAFAGIVCNYFRAVSNDRTSITTPVNTNTYLNGAKGERVAINMTAAAGFNMIARVKSTNGQFIFGCYNGDFQLYYISDGLVNASTNSYTNGITLMNENGHMIPLKNNSHDIGTSTYRYRYLHVVTTYTSRLNSIYSSSTSIYLGSDVSISSEANVMIGSSVARTGINNAVTLTCVNSNNIRIGVRHKAYSSSALTYFESDRDNMTVLGGASTRWKEIYAVTSSITTSDRREKKNISYMGSYSNEDTYMSDDTLQSFIRGLLPCIYLRIDGDSGRPHHGFIAQDVEKLMQELGIKDHAAFIRSPKTETIEIEEETEEEYTDEVDGQVKIRIVTQKREEQREIPGEYTYGLRYEEFIADIVRFVQILYDRNTELENALKEQKEKAESLEKRVEALENIIKQRAV